MATGGSGGGMGFSDKMSMIGGIVTAVGQLAEGIHGYQQSKELKRQLRFDTIAQWIAFQDAVKNENMSRVYNANIERQQAAQITSKTNLRFAQSGVSGQTSTLLKATQARVLEQDVEERSRQSRNIVTSLKNRQTSMLLQSKNQQTQLSEAGKMSLLYGFTGAASTGFQTASSIGSSQVGSNSNSIASSIASKGGK